MLTALLMALLLAAIAHAQPFPSRAVISVVPFAPGSGTDTGGRILAQQLSERWGQPVT